MWLSKRPFVKVHCPRRSRPAKNVARQFEHVVGVAGFRAHGGKVICEAVDREEQLIVAVTADDVRTGEGHPFPEELRRVAQGTVARQFVLPRQPDQLGNLRVSVLPIQQIYALLERVEDEVIVEGQR